MANLCPTFPITGVDRLGKRAESYKTCGFSDAGNFVLYPVRKSLVEPMPVCGFAPLRTQLELVELDNIFCNVLFGVHLEMLKLCFSFSGWIVRAKILLKDS